MISQSMIEQSDYSIKFDIAILIRNALATSSSVLAAHLHAIIVYN